MYIQHIKHILVFLDYYKFGVIKVERDGKNQFYGLFCGFISIYSRYLIINRQMVQGKKQKQASNGRWNSAEHKKFMQALQKYGRNWTLVQKKVKTRTLAQVRSHAQKCFLNMDEADIDALIGYDGNSCQSTRKPKKSSSNSSAQKSHKKNFINQMQSETEGNNKSIEVENSQVCGLLPQKLPKPATFCLTLSKGTSSNKETLQEVKSHPSLFVEIIKSNFEHFSSGGDFMTFPPQICILKKESQMKSLLPFSLFSSQSQI